MRTSLRVKRTKNKGNVCGRSEGKCRSLRRLATLKSILTLEAIPSDVAEAEVAEDGGDEAVAQLGPALQLLVAAGQARLGLVGDDIGGGEKQTPLQITLSVYPCEIPIKR